MQEKTSRFKGSVKLGCIVAIRADESLDRRVVLKQGDYDTGRYGTQYDCGVFSPYMDTRCEDLWRMTTLLNLDNNEIYEKYWDAGVPLMKQRIGSPVNEKSSDSVKLYKVLNPDTYSKMIGRIKGVDFVAAYGGVFSNGFKYIKLDQPKPFYEGILTSESLIKAINYLGMEYTIRDVSKAHDDETVTTVRNSKDEPVKDSMNIRMVKIQDEFIRKTAGDAAKANGENELADYFYNHIPKEKTWYDYCVELVNNAEPMYKNNWMPKLAYSMKHWATRGSSVNEATIDGMRVMSNRVNKNYGFDKLDYQEHVHWDIRGYEDISRKPIMRLFRYNQDCPENLAREYINQLVEDWDNGGKKEFEDNKYLNDMVLKGGIIPRVEKGTAYYKVQPSAKDIRDCILENRMYNAEEYTDNIDDERIKEVLLELGRRYFHDNVRDGGGNWKRAVIMCLRGDVKGTYMGFSQSSEERAIRANAEAAFAATEEERKKKIEEFEALKKKADKEKEDQKQMWNN